MSEMLLFNVDEGFTEALVRGMKKTFLDEDDYNALKSATSDVDFKTALEATDYEEVLVQEPSKIPPLRIEAILKQKLADDLQYLQAQASSPLFEFIDLMRHGYMIENTVNIIEGIKNKVDFEQLLKRANPLGEFPGMRTIKAAESENYANVYQTVLIDLPVGKYFHKLLENVLAASSTKDTNAIDLIMKDNGPEKTKNLLKKIWLTEMYKFCTTMLDGPSREIMEHLLKFESDCMTMQIIYNSLDNKELRDAKGRAAERQQYIHLLGYLHPGRSIELTNADTLKGLKDAVE
jgi:V-type H+-transporting ATPase subunit d